MRTKDLEKQLIAKRPGKSKPIASDYLSTGSTLLNCACTGNPFRGIIKGHYYFLVGDSGGGKTWICHTLAAEAAHSADFSNYRLIYDDVENGSLMDIRKYFGNKTADRLEPPAGTKLKPVYSDRIEDFYYHADDAVQIALKTGVPFIYFLDSMDSLGSKQEDEKFQKQKTADRKKTKVAGDFGDGKAKVNSRLIRKILKGVRKTKSIIVIVGQTRDNINAGMFEDPRTRSGGRSLTFYATFEFWTSIASHIRQEIRGKKRRIGVNIRVNLKKNRSTGRDRTVVLPIYHSYGIDDIGSCVDYLVDEKHWKQSRGVITAPELDLVNTRERLIRRIEKRGLESALRMTVGDVWDSIEKECEIVRKARYT